MESDRAGVYIFSVAVLNLLYVASDGGGSLSQTLIDLLVFIS